MPYLSNMGFNSQQEINELKEMDKIGYIRFASVYTNFKEVEEFEEYVGKLDEYKSK